MQQGLGIAAGLAQTLEHQITSRLERRRGLKVPRHVLVQRVAGVLAIHHRCHALEGFLDLCLAYHAMQQPVGDVLAGDTQGGAVFHQAHAVDVGHFGATDALVDPAHDVAEGALRF